MAFEHTTFPKKNILKPANVQNKKNLWKTTSYKHVVSHLFTIFVHTFSPCFPSYVPHVCSYVPHMFPIFVHMFPISFPMCFPYVPHISPCLFIFFPISFPISLFFFAQGRASERFFRASSKRLLGGTGKATRSTAAPIGPEIKRSQPAGSEQGWRIFVEIFEDCMINRWWVVCVFFVCVFLCFFWACSDILVFGFVFVLLLLFVVGYTAVGGANGC